MIFYHGTSSAFGDLEGDAMDPRKGDFEDGVVYATSDLRVARYWAESRCAVAGGAPVVYTVEIVGDVVNVTSVDGDVRDIAGGADVVIEASGEDGATVAHVVTRYGAEFGARV